MTDTTIVTLVTAIGALVTIIGGQIVNIIVSLRTNEKIVEVNTKADIITGHVNSAASAAAAKIEALQKEVIDMKILLAEQKVIIAQSVTKS